MADVRLPSHVSPLPTWPGIAALCAGLRHNTIAASDLSARVRGTAAGWPGRAGQSEIDFAHRRLVRSIARRSIAATPGNRRGLPVCPEERCQAKRHQFPGSSLWPTLTPAGCRPARLPTRAGMPDGREK